jgi:hypothetical protein
MGTVDLDSVAAKLYGVPPGDFTSSRSAEVRAARSAGDRELAAAVAQLRRPTVGAWLANQLARECKDELEALLELGRSMREAQGAGDGPQLRLLTRQRREMVTTLMAEARTLAGTRNQPLSEHSTRELENTLEAAVASADAANALRSGRLSVGLTYSGFGPLDLGTPLVTGTSKRADRGRSRSAESQTGRAKPHDDRSRLTLDLAAAEQKVKNAEDVVSGMQQEVKDTQSECEARQSDVVDAERHLRETKRGHEEAQGRLAEAKRAEKIAKKELTRAGTQRNKAEALLHQATSSET